jgi:hypothetical protein
VAEVNATFMSRVYTKAKEQGRLCSRCGWIINTKNWKKGYRLCGACWNALKGVNVPVGHFKPTDEQRDKTGEM